jgi:F0F1-type ATP synthase membrane subunit b/b'
MGIRVIWPFIILQVATVVAILFFIRSLLHKQLDIGLKRIKKLDEENLKKSTELNTKVEQLGKDYETKITDGEARAREMLEAAKEEVKKIHEAERIKAKDEAKRIIANALHEKEKLIKEAQQHLFEKAIDLSGEILKRVFSDDELKGMRGKIAGNVMGFLTDSEEVKKLLKTEKAIEVVSSDTLSENDKNRLIKILEAGSGGSEIKVKFSVDKGTLGGLVFKMGRQIVDGSIANRVHKAAQELRLNGK